MNIPTKKQVIESIRKREITLRGKRVTQYVCWLGTRGKKTLRVYSLDKAQLLKKIDEHFDFVKKIGPIADMISMQQAYEAATSIARLREAGIDKSLSTVVEEYISIVGDGIKFENAEKSIGEIFEIYIEDKIVNGQRDDARIARDRTGKFVTFFGRNRKFSELTATGLEQYLRKYDSNVTYNNILTYIKTFANWCVKNRYAIRNPIEDVRKKVIEWEEPEYATVEEVEKVVRLLERKEMWPELAIVVLSYFAGIRAAEIRRIMESEEAAKWDLSENVIRIVKVKGHTKGVMPRAFAFEPNAIAWLKQYDLLGELRHKNHNTVTDRMRRLFLRENIKLPHNAGRHSFITYHVAKFGEPQKTQALCGTSGKMLCHHYRGLASRAAGEAYFNIMPLPPAPEAETEKESGT